MEFFFVEPLWLFVKQGTKSKSLISIGLPCYSTLVIEYLAELYILGYIVGNKFNLMCINTNKWHLMEL